jgi:hypothetical protein
VYVAESHTDVTDPNLVGRVSVFNKDGKFLRTIGKAGTGPGNFERRMRSSSIPEDDSLLPIAITIGSRS